MTITFIDIARLEEFQPWQVAGASAAPAAGDVVDLDVTGEHYGPTPMRVVYRHWHRSGRGVICFVRAER